MDTRERRAQLVEKLAAKSTALALVPLACLKRVEFRLEADFQASHLPSAACRFSATAAKNRNEVIFRISLLV